MAKKITRVIRINERPEGTTGRRTDLRGGSRRATVAEVARAGSRTRASALPHDQHEAVIACQEAVGASRASKARKSARKAARASRRRNRR